ncbi:myosin regulatory light chain 10-like, partial [Leptonychotes weddellii]|uniref:Myosin regulatory light chain 10-like n=1 Tax=Leptonychotes weddellii TaxID=9713 RepID=A0A7F8QDF8_LEPWE
MAEGINKRWQMRKMGYYSSVERRDLETLCQAPRRARKRAEGGAGSNVFSMFDQSQIQEFKEAFTIMDQNRDGFIDKEDLRDTFAALGRINVKNEELEAMVKEVPGPINFTIFLTMFGDKLK